MFEPLTKEVLRSTVTWIAERGIFADSTIGSCQYEQSVSTLTP